MNSVVQNSLHKKTQVPGAGKQCDSAESHTHACLPLGHGGALGSCPAWRFSLQCWLICSDTPVLCQGNEGESFRLIRRPRSGRAAEAQPVQRRVSLPHFLAPYFQTAGCHFGRPCVLLVLMHSSVTKADLSRHRRAATQMLVNTAVVTGVKRTWEDNGSKGYLSAPAHAGVPRRGSTGRCWRSRPDGGARAHGMSREGASSGGALPDCPFSSGARGQQPSPDPHLTHDSTTLPSTEVNS